MKPLLFCFAVLLMYCCNTSDTHQSTNQTIDYQHIRDNLYTDDENNLYLKSVNREDLDHGTTHNVWLKTVYCDTCWTATDTGWKDITELKDFVDVDSWRLDTTNGSWTIYADKNHRYLHKHMADGGTITLLLKS